MFMQVFDDHSFGDVVLITWGFWITCGGSEGMVGGWRAYEK